MFDLIWDSDLFTGACQPCTDAEVLLSVCTSDFGKESYIWKKNEEICIGFLLKFL